MACLNSNLTRCEITFTFSIGCNSLASLQYMHTELKLSFNINKQKLIKTRRDLTIKMTFWTFRVVFSVFIFSFLPCYHLCFPTSVTSGRNCRIHSVFTQHYAHSSMFITATLWLLSSSINTSPSIHPSPRPSFCLLPQPPAGLTDPHQLPLTA